MDKKDKKELLEFLATQKLMSLATYGEKIWSATVYYLFDEDLNLYFLSPINSLHCLNIDKNPEVSLTIADSRQKASGDKIGLQMRGRAKKIKSTLMIKKIISMWNNKHFDAPPIKYQTLMKVWRSRFYQIEPEFIKLFSEKSGGEKESTWEL